MATFFFQLGKYHIIIISLTGLQTTHLDKTSEVEANPSFTSGPDT